MDNVFLLGKGFVLTKVHRICTFIEKPFLKSYIDKNTELRKEAAKVGNKFEVDLYKLLNNSLFGKTMENIRNRSDVELVRDKELAEKLVNSTAFKREQIINENLVAIEKRKNKVKLDKPVHIGFSVLELSKLIMYRFHIDYMKHKYGDKCQLMYTDTDSLMYEIYTDDWYEDMKKNIGYFDTSEYAKDNQFGMPAVNGKVPGLFKDDFGGKIIEEFVGLRAKMYSVKYGDTEKLMAKGIQRGFKEKHLHHEHYVAALRDQETVSTANFHAFRCKKKEVSTCSITKKCLSNAETKRYILDDGIHSLAYGYKGATPPYDPLLEDL